MAQPSSDSCGAGEILPLRYWAPHPSLESTNGLTHHLRGGPQAEHPWGPGAERVIESFHCYRLFPFANAYFLKFAASPARRGCRDAHREEVTVCWLFHGPQRKKERTLGVSRPVLQVHDLTL